MNSVVHAHNEAVLPFTIGSTPLRPVFHMGGVMGSQCPIYDIAQHYKTSDNLHSMLVTNEHLGAGLASGFNPSTMAAKGMTMVKNFVTSTVSAAPDTPPYPTVLMRGHGFTCIGETIEEAVYRAVYTCTNARIQTTSLLMQGTYNLGLIGERFGGGENQTGPAKHEDIKYLSEREAKDSWTANQANAERPWKMYVESPLRSTIMSLDLSGALLTIAIALGGVQKWRTAVSTITSSARLQELDVHRTYSAKDGGCVTVGDFGIEVP